MPAVVGGLFLAAALHVLASGSLAQEAGRGSDVLVLLDGSTRSGLLQACDSAGCKLDGIALPRSAIAWIGLDREDPSPPLVQSPATDETHLRDGTVNLGRLLRVTAEQVVTEPGSHPRPQVAWVHLAQPSEAAGPVPPGSAEHLYDAVVEVNVIEKLEYRDSAADIYPPCEIGTAERRVRWTARLPARYSRVDVAAVMQAAAEQAKAAGVPQEIYQLPEGQQAVTEVLSSDQNGETRFELFEEEVDQDWYEWAEGMCTFQGSYRPHKCKRSLTGKPLSIMLGWSPETGRVLATNGGPDIDGFIEVCSASYLNVSEFQPDWAPTQFGGSRALFDGVSIEPSADDVQRLRTGEEVVLRGGVRFKALSECCVGNSGFVRIGAVFDVHATAEIRLIPRR